MRRFKAIKVSENHFEVDMRGWVCPYPKYAVIGLIEKMPEASQMDLLVDCPSAPEDLPHEVQKSNKAVVSGITLISEGEWRVSIQKD